MSNSYPMQAAMLSACCVIAGSCRSRSSNSSTTLSVISAAVMSRRFQFHSNLPATAMGALWIRPCRCSVRRNCLTKSGLPRVLLHHQTGKFGRRAGISVKRVADEIGDVREAQGRQGDVGQSASRFPDLREHQLKGMQRAYLVISIGANE